MKSQIDYAASFTASQNQINSRFAGVAIANLQTQIARQLKQKLGRERGLSSV